MATLEIDDEVYEAVRLPETERSEVLKQELAVALYARDMLPFGKARTLAGLSKQAFHDLLGKRKIFRHYTKSELAEDVDYTE
jgi:predicted HTH domain antitoxin